LGRSDQQNSGASRRENKRSCVQLFDILKSETAASSWPGIAVRRTASLPLAYDPAIHVSAIEKKGVDARVKPGHDA
jgi:hypothetical protein